MIGFLVTMENINRNEHITPVFKIIISNPNKTPAQTFTPPADEKKCVLRKVLRRLRLKQGQMQELLGLMAGGGGVLIC